MRSISDIIQKGRGFVLFPLIATLLTGCSVVGPSAIRSGRIAYNEAISETNNQQMLMMVVRNRYQESGSMLSVASVTANVSYTTNAGIQLGFGNSDSYAGNLVPFGAGAVYEENPTISYIPVEGGKYLRSLLSPLPLTFLARLAGTVVNPAYIYTTLVSSVNGIKNPDFLFSSANPDPQFSRFVSIMVALSEAQTLHWAENPRQKDGFLIVIDHYGPAQVPEVNELLRLLGLKTIENGSPQVILPTTLALDGRKSGGIGFITRSVYDLVEILAATIEVPKDDQNLGITANYPPLGPVGREVQVRSSSDKPAHASVAVKYRDQWFYIDDQDHATKRFFNLMGILWSNAIADNTSKSRGPVLTVPVSR